MNLIKNIAATIILTSTALGTIWTYAAFTEPSAGPADSMQDFANNALGANNNNNGFDSSNVAANNDGSILERLEYLWTNRSSFGSTTSSNPGSWTCTMRSGSYSASCVGNEKAVSGGCYGSPPTGYSWTTNAPMNQGWICADMSGYGGMAYVNCCQ